MIDEKIKDWLEKTGFPLEMAAAAAFKDSDFMVRQSAVYQDPQEGKGREIDVLAFDSINHGLIEIYFVVECKSSTNPWVVLTSNEALISESRVSMFALATRDAEEALSKRLRNGGLGCLESFVPKYAHCGYGFRQALFTKDNDPAYAAAMGALKAAHGLTQESGSVENPNYVFAFPVIVIDSPLFECELKEDGDIKLTEVSESSFLFSAFIPHQVSGRIRVVTKIQLPIFAESARDLANSIVEELEAEVLAYLSDDQEE